MGAHLRIRPALPRRFRRLLASAWVSNTGDGVRNAVLPLIAASLAASTTTVTAVAAAGTLPFAVFGIVAGTMADRHDRVGLIFRAHLFRAVVVTAMAGLLWADELTVAVLVGFAFLLGCGEAVADSAAPALIPDLVDDDELERANSELETAELVANDLVGPSVGSALFAASASVPFVLDAVSFTTAAGLVRSLDRGHLDAPSGDDRNETDDPFRPEASDADVGAAAASWREDLIEGISTAWTNKVLRTTGLLVVMFQIGNLAAIAPIVVYVTERLGVDVAAYGLFLAVGSLGGIGGSRLARPAVRRIGSFGTLMVSVALAIVSFLVMMVPVVPVVATGFATSFGAVVVGRIVIITARQRSVPSRLLGRAQGAMRSLVWGAATVGALVGGAAADLVGDRAPFVVAASFYLVGALAGWRALRDVLAPDPARR
ncbi:MAG: MFS transporter [Acidimicrobiales bacterium]|nr:MFS transporter [Acidimicrobiales bacterium]